MVLCGFSPTLVCSNGRLTYLEGRVLERAALTKAQPHDSIWRNCFGIVARFLSAEVPGAALEVRYGRITVHTTTDSEGYYKVELEDHHYLGSHLPEDNRPKENTLKEPSPEGQLLERQLGKKQDGNQGAKVTERRASLPVHSSLQPVTVRLLSP